MRIKEGQIFNLMDTNGRRNDVINALQGYLTILDDIQNEQKMNWASMPESLAQYEFYRQAIELSPEVFGKHGPYDKLAETLERNKDFATAVQTQDMEWIQKNSFMFQSLVKQFDLGIEDRARHYTSNLVKLGFTDEGREISPVGELLLDLKKLRKDDLETMLPIDGVNIVYLRQLMKLRLFDTEGERYYSPFNLAIFALLKRHRLSENEFSELVQGLSPYSDFSDIEQYVLNYREGDIVSGVSIDIPAEIHTNERVSETVFRDNYKNRKSNAGVDIYWVYYNLLFDYLENPSSATIDKLLTFFENNKAMLNKAYFPEVDDLAEFIFNAKKEGKDIICQCEYGESRSSGCAAAIHEYFYKDGIKIFADYRYYPNQMVYHKVYDALEKYGVEKNVIRESGE